MIKENKNKKQEQEEGNGLLVCTMIIPMHMAALSGR